MEQPKCQRSQCNNLVTEKYPRKWQGWRKFCSKTCEGLAKQEKMRATLLEKHGVENSMHLDSTKEKIKKTNLERYGSEYPTSLPTVRKKIEQTNLDRYGVTNPFLCTERQLWIQEERLKKHGVRHSGQLHMDPEVVKLLNDPNWCAQVYNANGIAGIVEATTASRPLVWKYLRQHNIAAPTGSLFEQDVKTLIETLGFEVQERSRKIISPLEIDLYVPERKLAIECNGTYWHSELQGKDKWYHLNKTTLCAEQGISLIHIWEHNWISMPEIIKGRLAAKLGTANRIYARDTTVKIVSFKEVATFLDCHHFQGSCPSSINIGMFNNNQLVGVMTLGKSRFNKSVEYELLRLCFETGSTVVGGASKMFKFFTRMYAPKSVITYSDKSWNAGSVYKSIGFSYSHTAPPGYKYTTDYLHFESRVKYQKHKLKEQLQSFDSNLTEWENMQANGFDRIWDCGNDVWFWLTDQ